MKTLIYYCDCNAVLMDLFTQRQCRHISLCVCIYKYVVLKSKLTGGETLEYVWKEDFWFNLGHYWEFLPRWLRKIINVCIRVADYRAEIWNVMSRVLELSRHPFLEDMDLRLPIKFQYYIWKNLCGVRLCLFPRTHVYVFTHIPIITEL
jgi:hypothetical protein